MINWDQNQNWKVLPKPEVGDIVQLKIIDAFEYLVKAVVTEVRGNEISAYVEALFDWQTKGYLTGGDMFSIVGKQISFKQNFIQNVIKKPKTESIISL